MARTTRYRALLLSLGVLTGISPVHPALAEPTTWTADNGNGTFTNPLFFDEFSDPDLICVGDDGKVFAKLAPGLSDIKRETQRAVRPESIPTAELDHDPVAVYAPLRPRRARQRRPRFRRLAGRAPRSRGRHLFPLDGNRTGSAGFSPVRAMSRAVTRMLLVVTLLSVPWIEAGSAATHRSEIRIRDPFVLPDPATQTYYIYGTTTSGIFDGEVERKAVMVFKTKDLEHWEDPVPVWEVPAVHWGRETVWAPEVHHYRGRYYLFVTITSKDTLPTPAGRPQNVRRGTEILVAGSPLGPFQPLGRGPQTPPDWMALDGSLWIEDGVPYMVFCHEWAQITDGSFDIVRLSEDLAKAAGEPQLLFHASEAPWVRCRGDIGELYQGKRYHAYVSDGNWLHRTRDGTLLLLWSSYGPSKYAVGIARSKTGNVFGPWEQLPDPLWSDDGGHPMLFETFDGRLVMVIHQPNRQVERARFFEIEDLGDTLRIVGEIGE